jgi:hypothetical protein
MTLEQNELIRRRKLGSSDNLDALDFDMAPGCVLAQLGGLAGAAAWYTERFAPLRNKYWPSVLGWNLALGAVMTSARGVRVTAEQALHEQLALELAAEKRIAVALNALAQRLHRALVEFGLALEVRP